MKTQNQRVLHFANAQDLAYIEAERRGVERAAKALEKWEQGQLRHNNKRAKWVTEAARVIRNELAQIEREAFE